MVPIICDGDESRERVSDEDVERDLDEDQKRDLDYKDRDYTVSIWR